MAEPEDIRPAIGIDLGTTNSRVGIWLDEENRFELISNDHGYQSTPSYVAFTETERLIGDAAKDQVSKNPGNTVFDAKRLIGRKFSDLGTDANKLHIQWPFEVARGEDDKPMIHVEYKGKEKVFSAMDVCSMILGKMKDLAEVYSGSVVTGASVSVPHCFTFAQRQATRNACSLAGFETITLVNEPICAALAYTLKTIGPSVGEKKVMIFDLGGGSLDVTLFNIEEGVIEVKATSGDSQLGGEDFDLRLLHHFIQEIKQKYERDITSHPRVVRRLKNQVERVKLALSSAVETTIQIDSLLEDFNFYSSISRACFEKMNMDLFEKCIKCVEECLQRAGLEKTDVYEVVLIGGSSRIPKVQELLAEFFNDKSKLNTSINPDEAVVCGAAARAGISRGCKAFADYLVVDVLPMSLGLETVEGAMHVMHPRNFSIPRSSEQLFTTVYDDQPGIFIQVYEGENSQTCDNMLIATIELPGIPPAPRGVPQILVRFDVDAYGILTVSAKDKTTGEKVEIYMDQDADIDRVHLDDERRRQLPIQVYHPSVPSENPNDSSSLLGPHESGKTSESSPHEFSEPSPVHRSSIAIESMPQEFSEPLESYEPRNTAEGESHEISEQTPAFQSSNAVESRTQEFSEPPPAFESSKAVESRSQEFSEQPSAFESASKAMGMKSQEFSEPPPAFESSKAVESRSQEFSEQPSAFESASKAVGMKSQDFSEPPPAFESSKAVGMKFKESSEPPSAFESSKAVESRSPKFSEPPPAFQSASKAMESKSQEFAEPPPAFESSNAMESRSQAFFEPSPEFDTVEIESPDISELSPTFESSDNLKSSSQEFFEAPQAFESISTEESRSLEFLEPPIACRSSDTIKKSSQEFPGAPQAHESNSTAETKSQDFSEPQASESSNDVKSSSRVSLVQEILDTVHLITPISDFRTHKRECSTFIRRVNMLVPLFEEFRDLELPLTEETSTCFKSLEAALNTAKDLLLLCSKGSKLWLILEQRKVAEQFLLLNTALVQALDKLPDSLGISDEVQEQVDLVHNQLKRSKALEDAVDAQLSAELIAILDVTNECSPDQLRSLAESFKLDTASALRKELEAVDGMTREKAPGSVSMRGFDQVFGLLSALRNLFPVEDSEQHEFSKPTGAHGSSNVLESRSQESSAPPPLPSTSSNVTEGTRSQEFSAQPPQFYGGVESRSQEVSAQPVQSPYSSSNSIDARSFEYSEPAQVKGVEKINAQDFSAPPPPSPPLLSNSSNITEGRSQFSAQPPQSPYSSSNSIDGRSFAYSEPAQVKGLEKIMAQELFSAPLPPTPLLPSTSRNGTEGRSQEFPAHTPQFSRDVESRSFQEFSAQPPQSPYSSSNSIDGRSLEHSERAQSNRVEKINAQDFSAPPPTHKPSYSLDGRPPHGISVPSPQVYRPSNSFGSRSSEFEPLPTHSSSSTPEGRSEEFPEYSSKPEFPEHSPVYKVWNGLEGRPPPEPSTHRMSSSPGSRRYVPSELSSVDKSSNASESRRHEYSERLSSNISVSSSATSSEDFSGSGPIRAQNQNPVSDTPELRRAITSVDDPLNHPPRAENARSASCPQIRTSDSIIEDVVKKYTWDQVLDMTNDLSKTIGKGGFGAVYLGKLDNEKEVAVKILDASSQQGITEFLNEVNLLKRVNHVNLVRLLGYCLDEKQVLIYEFAEEGSIWDHLQVGGKVLDWKTRLKVALESACGLEYLHTGCHPRIIHRDIKSQNILLTKTMVAKVADFGLSKLGADQDNISKTHVTTMVKGTLGYLDPEYLKTGQLTEKSDVYSFGVVLLEIVTGRKPIQNTDRKGFIGDWVEEHYNSNGSSRQLKHVADPTLGGHFNSKAMKLVLNVAKDCIHPYGMDRPEMTDVVHVLRKAQSLEQDEKKSSKWLPFL
ncbi:hypothetical protein M758_1G176500 [Ceratodon purpureus]|nr:hypothetical protein M758_1G176500 [Ceratodon purpureus]